MSYRTNFWSPKAIEKLKACGRQDLIDKGDALAQRVTALMNTAKNRFDTYLTTGDIYSNGGGEKVLNSPHFLSEIDKFVNDRLPKELNALEQVLAVFDDLNERDDSKLESTSLLTGN